MNRLVALLFIWVGITPVKAQTNCTLRKDQDSIKVYTCHNDTSKFKSITAEFTMHATLDEVEKFFLDFPGYVNWQFNTVTSTLLEKVSSTEFIYYTIIDAPWPVTDRDMVVKLNLYRSDRSLIITANSVASKIPSKNEYIRVPVSHSVYEFQIKSRNSLSVSYKMQIDPGGSVPIWLVNLVCAQAPYLSFKKMKEQISKNR
ncbi:MAG: hypothetical protein JSS79_06305 [Bacteroidetes bacterium]|nr:hypothetical protein [Bacteroidota bacterium]